jgi:hypothetical protein
LLAHGGSVEFPLRDIEAIRTVVSGGSAGGGHVDKLTNAATGERDDRGTADVSKDTDRDPEADAPSAYRDTS